MSVRSAGILTPIYDLSLISLLFGNLTARLSPVASESFVKCNYMFRLAWVIRTALSAKYIE